MNVNLLATLNCISMILTWRIDIEYLATKIYLFTPNWNDLQKSSPDSHSFNSSSQTKRKRKRDDNNSNDEEPAKREKTVDDEQKD